MWVSLRRPAASAREACACQRSDAASLYADWRRFDALSGTRIDALSRRLRWRDRGAPRIGEKGVPSDSQSNAQNWRRVVGHKPVSALPVGEDTEVVENRANATEDRRGGGLLDVQARLAAQRTAIGQMRNAEVDDSIVAALQAAVDALQWYGTFKVYDSGAGGDTSLLSITPEDAREQYHDLSLQLNELVTLIASEPSGADALAEEVGDALEAVVELLRELGRRTDRSEGMSHSLATTLSEALEDRYVGTSTTLNSFRLWLRTKGAVVKLEETADSRAELAGDESEIKLSTEFDGLAKKEAFAANVFRGLTVFLFLVVIGYAAAVAYSSKEPSVEVAQKLAVGVPVLLLAGYFSREAGHHRKTARWSSVLGVQLRSVRAYTVGLDPDEVKTLRADFGRRVFMETPDTSDAGGANGATEGGQAQSPLDAGLVREVTELVRAVHQKPGA